MCRRPTFLVFCYLLHVPENSRLALQNTAAVLFLHRGVCAGHRMYIIITRFREMPWHCHGTTCGKTLPCIPRNLPRTSTAYRGTLTLALPQTPGAVNRGCHGMSWGCHRVPWGMLRRLPRGLPLYHPWHVTEPPTACHGIQCHAIGCRGGAMVCNEWVVPWQSHGMPRKCQSVWNPGQQAACSTFHRVVRRSEALHSF